MHSDDQIRLWHMLDGAREAISFAQSKKRSDLDEDRMLVLALVKAIEIIGEAAYQITNESQEKMPTIPWADIIGMRHRLVHAYFDINLDILWQTVKEDLPELISQIEQVVPQKQDDS